MDFKYLLLLLCMINVAALINAVNILVILPWPWFSHFKSYQQIIKGLAARGHNVTLVSPFQQNTSIPNLTQIVFPFMRDKLLGSIPPLSEPEGIMFKLFGLWQMGTTWVNITLHEDVMKKLINDTSSNYDAVIVETGFLQEPFLAFGHKYNATVINFSQNVAPIPFYRLTGNYLSPSYIPVVRLPFNDRMTFFERVENFFYYCADIIIGEFYYLKIQDAVMREHFNYPGSESLPPLTDLIRNTSLTVIDISFSIGYPTPFHKNVVEFGGAGFVKHPEKLPKDLQEIMDNTKDGIIFFSLGSHFKFSLLKNQTQFAIISALSKLKEKVFMKLEGSNQYFNNTSTNIITREWFPQPSILAHANCKMFITHCGYHSLMEGVYYKTPLMAITIFCDHVTCGKFIETVGIGSSVSAEKLTEQKLLNKINSVLNNPLIEENINKRSEIFKDSVKTGVENAISWIEYVIRHKGAAHLRPAVLDLYWYQELMLDVIAFYLLVLIIIIFIIKTILTLIYKSVKCLVFKKCAGKEVHNKKSKKE